MLRLATEVVEQDGIIDNIFVSPVVHRTSGMVVLLAMVAATAYLVWLAVRKQPLDLPARVLVVVAELTLMVQALIGIKLLDQGLGVAQLFIHYVGGLIPLGAFLAASWVAWRSEVAHARALAALSSVGLLSAVMAFTIGRAYVAGTL